MIIMVSLLHVCYFVLQQGWAIAMAKRRTEALSSTPALVPEAEGQSSWGETSWRHRRVCYEYCHVGTWYAV